jgi:hypothetical protein
MADYVVTQGKVYQLIGMDPKIVRRERVPDSPGSFRHARGRRRKTAGRMPSDRYDMGRQAFPLTTRGSVDCTWRKVLPCSADEAVSVPREYACLCQSCQAQVNASPPTSQRIPSATSAGSIFYRLSATTTASPRLWSLTSPSWDSAWRGILMRR